MNKNEFWELIDAVNEKVPHRNPKAILRETKDALVRRSPLDVVEWKLIMQEYHAAAYRNNLWAASAALGAHYTDDGFIDFRSWLISCGRQVYMNALEDPDSLVSVNSYGERRNFEEYGYIAYDAHTAHIFAYSTGEGDSLEQFYSQFDENHKLSAQTLQEIQAELPSTPDIQANWTPLDLYNIVPRICKRRGTRQAGPVVSYKKISQMIESENLIHAYVYENSECTEYMFSYTPENIAWFVGSRPFVEKMILTDVMDCFVLNTIGNFIDQCPDKALLEAVKKVLVPI